MLVADEESLPADEGPSAGGTSRAQGARVSPSASALKGCGRARLTEAMAESPTLSEGADWLVVMLRTRRYHCCWSADSVGRSTWSQPLLPKERGFRARVICLGEPGNSKERGLRRKAVGGISCTGSGWRRRISTPGDKSLGESGREAKTSRGRASAWGEASATSVRVEAGRGLVAAPSLRGPGLPAQQQPEPGSASAIGGGHRGLGPAVVGPPLAEMGAGSGRFSPRPSQRRQLASERDGLSERESNMFGRK